MTKADHKGEWGEDLVAQWLKTQDWIILARRWRSRWGEIDLIAQSDRQAILAFIEVKTRSAGNWDESGLLAINPRKQQKLLTTAQIFLARFPHLENSYCRFDVALVHCRPGNPERVNKNAQFTQWREGYILTLQDYLEAAFMGDNS